MQKIGFIGIGIMGSPMVKTYWMQVILSFLMISMKLL